MASGVLSERRTRGRIPPHILPLVVLAIGLLASAAAGWQVERLSRAKDQERFQGAVQQAQDDILNRMQAYIGVLRATAGLVAAEDGAVTREQFAAFAQRLQLARVYPGIQGVGYSAVLPSAEGPQAEAALVRYGAADITITPAEPRPQVHAIIHLEPLDRRNRAALGYDMFAEPTRRAAMERARDRGRSAMSGRVELVQEIDDQKQAGFLIYHPVYRGGAPPATVAERRARLLGFAYSPFRADDLLRGIFVREQQPRIHIAVYDDAIAPQNLLHKSFAGAPDQMARTAWFTAVRPVEIAGRRWQIAYYSTPSFEGDSTRGLGLAFFAGGLVATLLVAGASAWQARLRLAAEAEVAARRESEQQRELLVGELNHRVKNTLATVQSIAAQTLREGKSLEDTRDSFESRLLALSETHNLLTRDHWRGAGLRELVEVELAPYAGARERIDVTGEEVWLAPDTALALGMALHELATNALKYGALSGAEGRVRISWRRRAEAGADRLRLVWEEAGGPPVTPPTRRGFGSRLIETGLRRQLRGEVELAFRPQGVCCTIDLPLEAAERATA
ncbi:CHASE domain-containing protein [Phenylobacterium sp.]|uniref:CHASE domain-containing protein n=1 Tax=Phenylobacterium sp. TaxID=1871053 RepID=UPI002D05AC83|nr:CHASE domain-containing protein [Phenylobacterium sp.]HVI33400.1 CHASE domain-containing protein [Phenylobacterium sp.]